jgi:hypothetical protein
MASGKKVRKQAKQSRKARQPVTGTFRHRDGDRRHREGMAKAVKQAKAEKAALRHIGAVAPAEEEGEPH